MKQFFLLLFLISLISAQENLKYDLKNKLAIGADLGVIFTSSDYDDIGAGFTTRGLAEYYIFDGENYYLGLRGFGGYGVGKGMTEDQRVYKFVTELYFISGGLSYSYRLSDKFLPYIYLGGSILAFNPEDENGNALPNNAAESYNQFVFIINAEFGVKYFINDRFIINAGVTNFIYLNDYIDDISTGSADDFSASVNLGFQYVFTPPWVSREKIKKEKPDGMTVKPEETEKKDPEKSNEKTEPPVTEEKTGGTDEEVADEDESPNIDVLDKAAEVGIVHFGFGETEISRFEYIELDRIVDKMKQNPKAKWKIVGYTDDIEPVEVHQSLAIQRAYFVLRYFMSKDIDRNRFEVVVKGEENPVADNSTEEGRALNRRVEIIKMN